MEKYWYNISYFHHNFWFTLSFLLNDKKSQININVWWYKFLWLSKNENLRTVEGVLNLYLKKIFNEDIDLTFASRTDRGVHALGQVVNFKVDTKIPTQNIKKILNNKLPDDLRVKEIDDVDLNFSSRFDSKGKIYFFIVNNSFETPNPILSRYSLWFPYKIDYNRLKENIALFIGKKDFSSFTTEEEREKVQQ